jgi:LmbE family N-acetylglucosaminyl deacetylase
MNSLTVNIVSPHRDDAGLSLGATIARLAGGHAVRIVNCFSVSGFAPHANGTEVPADVNELRSSEDREFAARIGGRLEIKNLVRLDAPIRLGCRVSDVRSAVSVGEAGMREAEAIRIALDRCAPGILLLPLAIGAHIDHRVALEAGLRAASLGRACGFYEDLPYAAEGRRCCVTGAIAGVSRRLGSPLLAALSAFPSGCDKRELLACYRSQISEGQMNTIVEYGIATGGERLWLTQAAARELRRAGIAFARPLEPARPQPWGEWLQCSAHRGVERAHATLRRRLRNVVRGEGFHETVRC